MNLAMRVLILSLACATRADERDERAIRAALPSRRKKKKKKKTKTRRTKTITIFESACAPVTKLRSIF